MVLEMVPLFTDQVLLIQCSAQKTADHTACVKYLPLCALEYTDRAEL